MLNHWLTKANNIDPNIHNFINGQYTAYRFNNFIPKYSPRNGQFLYGLNTGSEHEVNAAVANAKAAFADGRWSQLPIKQRASILLRLAALIESKAEEFALLECLDVGKPISAALNDDLPMVLTELRFCANAIENIYSKHYFTDPRKLAYQSPRPIGVVAGIIGWNFPLLLAISKIAPALAMGNCLVLKPSEFTSLSACRLAALAIEAGVPPGVLNVVHGTGEIVGSELAYHQDIKLLSFTGSSETGKQLMIAAGKSNMKRLMLECGGKSANIVFDDCPEDLAGVADALILSAFKNQGEVCSAGTRLLVHEKIKAKLLPLLLERLARLKPNDPLDPATDFGAMLNHEHLQKVLAYIDSGKKQGAKLIYGGKQVQLDLNGYYLEPTLFDDVNSNYIIAQEEIFGPVLSIFSFRDEEQALRIANDSRYGLTATVWTQNLARAQRMAQRIEAGMIEIKTTTTPSAEDAPFSVEGQKGSGFGKEGGLEGMLSYTLSCTVNIEI